jgi:hypothetical protein
MVSVIQYFLLYYRPRKPSSEALYYYTLLFNFHSIENLIPMHYTRVDEQNIVVLFEDFVFMLSAIF